MIGDPLRDVWHGLPEAVGRGPGVENDRRDGVGPQLRLPGAGLAEEFGQQSAAQARSGVDGVPSAVSQSAPGQQ